MIALHFLASQNFKAEDITEFRLSLGDRNTWNITPEKIKTCLPNATFQKRNDFESNAYGIAFADPDKFMLLNTPAGTGSTGSAKIVIGIGTGLGIAQIICPDKGPPVIQRNHGAHMIPATITEEQRYLYQSVQKFKPDQSVAIYEDLISGPGLWRLYQLACESAHTHTEYADTNDMIARGRNDPLVQQSLKIFHENFGLFVHQATAFAFAYKGIYLTGGIIDRLVGQNLLDLETIEQNFKQNNVPIVTADVNATPIYWVKDEYIALEGLLRI